RSAYPCRVCGGTRIVPEALWVKVGGKNIADISDMPVSKLSVFFKRLKITDFEKEIAKEILKQINSRVGFLLKVGLDYLTLSRLAK
ncbi:MAG: hypothetical protein GTN99_10245, partial [Candidatus Dadabacteria bacterium]|nr:hypothetical protein [Candidatus Dadabacteria bacterium]